MHEVKNEVTKIIQRFQVTPQSILVLPATAWYQLRKSRFRNLFIFNFYLKGSTSTATKTTKRSLKKFGRVKIEYRSRIIKKFESWFLFAFDFTRYGLSRPFFSLSYRSKSFELINNPELLGLSGVFELTSPPPSERISRKIRGGKLEGGRS